MYNGWSILEHTGDARVRGVVHVWLCSHGVNGMREQRRGSTNSSAPRVLPIARRHAHRHAHRQKVLAFPTVYGRFINEILAKFAKLSLESSHRRTFIASSRPLL
jgi:hypothetical protein